MPQQEQVYYHGRLGRITDRHFELPGVSGPVEQLRRVLRGRPSDYLPDWMTWLAFVLPWAAAYAVLRWMPVRENCEALSFPSCGDGPCQSRQDIVVHSQTICLPDTTARDYLLGLLTIVLPIVFLMLLHVVNKARTRESKCLTLGLWQVGLGVAHRELSVSCMAAPRPISQVLAGFGYASMIITDLTTNEVDQLLPILQRVSVGED